MIAYRITNTATGAQYVGITKGAVRRRFLAHLQKAERGASNTYLARSIRKYGRAAFVVEVLASAMNEADLIALEILLIAQERTLWSVGGYNLTIGGDGRRSGRFTAEETAKTAAKNRGLIRTAEQRARMSAGSKGKPKSPEHRKALSAAHLGDQRSPESIEKSAAFHRGRKRAPKAAQRISAALSGRRYPERHRAACPAGHPRTGANVSVSTRKDGTRRRECLACAAARTRQYTLRKSYEMKGARDA